MSREDIIRSLIDKTSRGLEIGPSYNPIAARRLGYRVDVLDHASAEDLRAKYSNEPSVDTRRIEDVDFVWNDLSLSKTVGAAGIYDYIVASHVIEHTPDILGFVSECSLLLKPKGKLVLAVPDMRRCFDACRPLTSLGGVLQAHHENRTRHSAATAFDHVAYMTALNGQTGWSRTDNGTINLLNDLTFANAVYKRSIAESTYYDFHAWVFTPSSFRLLMADLFAIGELTLREAQFLLTDGSEFISVLSCEGSVEMPSRSELCRSIRLELMEWPDK